MDQLYAAIQGLGPYDLSQSLDALRCVGLARVETLADAIEDAHPDPLAGLRETFERTEEMARGDVPLMGRPEAYDDLADAVARLFNFDRKD